MSDDWMTDEHKAAALEGWMSHPKKLREQIEREGVPETWIPGTADDLPRLRAEVTALRAELDAARADLQITQRANDIYAAEDAARAERTEPATGEDVETVAELVWDWLRDNTELPEWRDADEDDRDGAREGGRRILAALDLPGREQALREEILLLRRERPGVQPTRCEVLRHTEDGDHAGCVLPAGHGLHWDGSGWIWRLDVEAENERLTAERDAARESWDAAAADYNTARDEREQITLVAERYANERNTALAEVYRLRSELANVTSAHNDLKNAYDLLHVARDNTARLLEEAREVLAEITGLHREAKGTLCSECGHLWPCQTYQLALTDARQHAGGEGGGS